ncbi:MAG: hypothetical protein ACJATA_002047, partial [Sphingobacteriales bacterium]
MIYRLIIFLFCPIISMGQFSEEYWTSYSTSNSNISSNNLQTISFSTINPDVLYLGTKDGFSELNISNNVISTAVFPNINPFAITEIIENVDSSIILSHAFSGLSIRKKNVWEKINSQNSGLLSDSIFGLALINDTLHIAHLYRGVQLFHKDSFWRDNGFVFPNNNSNIGGLETDIDGNLYAIGKGYYAVKSNNSWEYKNPLKDSLLIDSNYNGIHYDRQEGVLYVGAPLWQGFLMIKGEKIEQFKIPELDVYDDIVNSIKLGPFNRIWFCTNQGGVFIFNPKTKIAEINFSDFDSPLPNKDVRDVEFDLPNQTAYFATWGGGLAKWEYGKDPEFMAVMSAPEVKSPTPLLISQNDKQLIIQNLAPQSIISIYNLQGQLLIREKSNNQTAKTLSPNFPSGIYLFKTTSPTGSTSQKFLFT